MAARFSYWLSSHLGLLAFLLFAAIAFFSIKRRKHRTRIGSRQIKDAIKKNMHEPATLHPEINPALCAGCGTCVKACPEGEILQLINHRAVLVAPSQCVGHGRCEVVCPFGAIELVFGTKTRGMDIPRITANYETNVPGLYIAGELGGMGLISNAVKQGISASEHALSHLRAGLPQTDVDLLIVGAGPAGLAASMLATAHKKSYVCLEQNSFGGTVYNFPRQKVVMTVPAKLPLVGSLKFPHNKVSKEELLHAWQKLRKHFRLKIVENTKFETLEKKGDIFYVKTNKGVIKAQKVILAMGVRGSPRKLGLPNEDLQKVTYNLIDPEQYQGKNIVVVGGGNAGVEAAQMLCEPKYRNTVILLVRGAALDRANEDNINIITAQAQKKWIQIWFNSSIKEIHKEYLIVEKNKSPQKIPNDFVFIFAGAEMPHKFLMSLGIEIEKKFGESLKKVG